MKRYYRALLAPMTALLLAATAAAQNDDWQKKPYKEWTKQDAQKVLNDSPWAKTEARSGGGGMATTDKVYTIRLRSSIAIRLALLRLRQIEEKYDQMNDKKRAEFDEKNKALVECPACAENYAISLVPPAASDARFVSLDKMKLNVRLIDDRGRSRELVHFTPTKVTGQEITFFFPRLDDKGEPLLTPSSKKLIFTIDTSVIGLDTVVSRFEFDVSKISMNGKVEF